MTASEYIILAGQVKSYQDWYESFLKERYLIFITFAKYISKTSSRATAAFYSYIVLILNTERLFLHPQQQKIDQTTMQVGFLFQVSNTEPPSKHHREILLWLSPCVWLLISPAHSQLQKDNCGNFPFPLIISFFMIR